MHLSIFPFFHIQGLGVRSEKRRQALQLLLVPWESYDQNSNGGAGRTIIYPPGDWINRNEPI